ncbi:hypothetical protein HSR122_1931 [Halapricum desulfuricans]|uniref:Twin-arginine translocation signal domain-containing protein n=1 Tax=Halapricum desulfuricans TaxID=2841257 RepID=A0A897NG45_9EURY|nr:hypothetical protein HSR122_1931 [Halapricum desulfuricans]
MTPDIGRRTALKAIGATGAAFALGGIGTAGARGPARAKGRGIANERRRQGASAEPTIVELAIAANAEGGQSYSGSEAKAHRVSPWDEADMICRKPCNLANP